MLKTFIFGIVFGLAGTFALLFFVPAVDQYREASHIQVLANGGNLESFHIDLPRDRVLSGIPGSENLIPFGIEWPNDQTLSGSQTEIFKLRDKYNEVVGIASRISSNAEPSGSFMEWVLHLPARGSMFIAMQLDPVLDGNRAGVLRAGTGEFSNLSGDIQETYVADLNDPESEANSRIQLVSILTGVEDNIE